MWRLHVLCVVCSVIGAELSESEQDTHFVLEYETNDICGKYTAPRANRYFTPQSFFLTVFVENIHKWFYTAFYCAMLC